MRAIGRPCGHHLEEMQRTDEQIRERVAKDAYETS
jgi:hypothetical protein